MKFVKSLAQSQKSRSSSHAHIARPVPGQGQSKRGVRKTAADKSREKALQRQRKVVDTEPGFLRRARLRKQSTRDQYADSWKTFMTFCVAHHLMRAVASRFVSMHQLDSALESFGEHLFLSGLSKTVLTCALQNVNIEYPCWPTSARVNFPLTKAAKKGWGNLEPGASKDPCPMEIAFWIAYDLLNHGLPLYAVAVVLCFDTYVRPGKVCELTPNNIVPPARGLHAKYGHWTLLLHPQELHSPSKVGQYNDSIVIGSSGREWISNLVEKLYAIHTGDMDMKLFPFTLNQFEKVFKESTERL